MRRLLAESVKMGVPQILFKGSWAQHRGLGILLSAQDGLVLTCAHVIAPLGEIVPGFTLKFAGTQNRRGARVIDLDLGLAKFASDEVRPRLGWVGFR